MNNHDVTVVELTADIGRDDASIFKLGDFLEARPNVTLLRETQCKEILPDAVIVAGRDGVEKKIATDTVILSVGFKSNNANIEPYYDITPNVSMIGDLRRPATIRECEEEGYFAVSET